MKRVLVIGLRAGSMDVLEFYLQSHGFSVQVADSPSRAMLTLAAERFDAVLVEAAPAGYDGATLALRLREAPGAERLVIVGLGDDTPGTAAGCDAVLPHHTTPQQLVATLRRCMRKSAGATHRWTPLPPEPDAAPSSSSPEEEAAERGQAA